MLEFESLLVLLEDNLLTDGPFIFFTKLEELLLVTLFESLRWAGSPTLFSKISSFLTSSKSTIA